MALHVRITTGLKALRLPESDSPGAGGILLRVGFGLGAAFDSGCRLGFLHLTIFEGCPAQTSYKSDALRVLRRRKRPLHHEAHRAKRT